MIRLTGSSSVKELNRTQSLEPKNLQPPPRGSSKQMSYHYELRGGVFKTVPDLYRLVGELEALCQVNMSSVGVARDLSSCVDWLAIFFSSVDHGRGR